MADDRARLAFFLQMQYPRNPFGHLNVQVLINIRLVNTAISPGGASPCLTSWWSARSERKLREGRRERLDGFEAPEALRGEEFDGGEPEGDRLDDLRGRDDAGKVGNFLLQADECDLFGEPGRDDKLCPRMDGADALLGADDRARSHEHIGVLVYGKFDGILRAVGAEADLRDGQPPFHKAREHGLRVL